MSLQKMSVNKILVVGASNMDICSKSFSPIREGDSNIGEVSNASGGVGRNIAVALKRLGCSVQFLTAIANDSFGLTLSSSIKEDGISLLLPLFDSSVYRTGVYSYTLDSDGTLVCGVNDMTINEGLDCEKVLEVNDVLKCVDCVVFEANIPEKTIKTLVDMEGKFVADCVSVVKARKLSGVLDKLFLLKANYAEACELAGMDESSKKDPYAVAQRLVAKGLKRGIITLGSQGAFCFEVQFLEGGGIAWYKVEPPKDGEIVNTNGCGDALLAGFLSSYLKDGDMKKALAFGQQVASVNARSNEAISQELESFV